jgi:hypothetical protein
MIKKRVSLCRSLCVAGQSLFFYINWVLF